MRGILEQIVAHPQGVDRGDARRDPALHQAVLDQQRALQQPHRAQVRAQPARRRRLPRGEGRGRGGRPSRRRRANRSTRCWRGCSRCSSIRTSIRSSPTRRRARPRTSSRRAPTTSTRASAMADLKGFTEKHGLNSRLVKRDGRLVEEVYKIDGRYGAQIARRRQAPRGGDPVRDRADGQRAARADQFYRTGDDADRERTTSRGCRTRRRRSTRSTASSRSTWTRAASRARGKRWSSTSTRRRPRASSAGRQRAVVRGPHAVGSEYRKPNVTGHRRQRHRRGRRDRRLRTGHADRHQPAERSAHPRAVRQQVGGAVERHRGLRQVDAGSMRSEFSWTPRRRSAPRSSGRSRRADHRHARGDRPRLGTPWRNGFKGRRRR